jgi:hypothetical protein
MRDEPEKRNLAWEWHIDRIKAVEMEAYFVRSDRKLIEMLQALDKRAPDDLRAFWKSFNKNKDKPGAAESLLKYGMNTRELSNGVLGSKFYARHSSIIDKADKLNYIRRERIKRRRPQSKKQHGQRGNPNLVMNYISNKGRMLLIELGLREGSILEVAL